MQSLLDRLATRSSLLAAELTRAGAPIVVVGSTAHRLRGGHGTRPRDLDLAVADSDLEVLLDALATLGIQADPARVRRSQPWTTPTPWGPLDVFVRLTRPPSTTVLVDGVEVAVDAE